MEGLNPLQYLCEDFPPKNTPGGLAPLPPNAPGGLVPHAGISGTKTTTLVLLARLTDLASDGAFGEQIAAWHIGGCASVNVSMALHGRSSQTLC